jgi:hypothetical protein
LVRERRIVTAAAQLIGCVYFVVGCSGTTADPDASPRSDALVPMVNLSGQVSSSGRPTVDATAAIVEFPDISQHVDAEGEYLLRVPQNVPLTLELSAPGRIPLRTQMIRVRADFDVRALSVFDPARYDEISALGPAPSGALFLVEVLTMNSCNLDGAHITVTPDSGTVVYAGPTGEPDPALTSLTTAVPVAYVVDVTGTVTLGLRDIVPPCEPLSFPVVATRLTYEGPVVTADRTVVFYTLYAL